MKHNKLMKLVTIIAYLTALVPFAVHAAGVIQLPQTGQTSCYGTAGVEIPCTGTGQDGDIRAGVPWPNPRFTDNGDQTVLDNLTGLIWTKDGNLMKTRDPGFGTEYTTGDGRVPWQPALDYIKKLNTENFLGHNDWRLPNVIEINSMAHSGQSNPDTWFNSQGFINVQAGGYWSSTTVASLQYWQWVGSLSNGSSPSGNTQFPPSYYVWPVRSGQSGTLEPSIIALPKTGQTTCYGATACAGTGQDGDIRAGVPWPNPRFTDNGDQTILDNLTGLIWTKDGGLSTGTKTWQEALSYVKGLNFSNYLGHSDWRLPNRIELLSLDHAGQSNPVTWFNSQGFINVRADIYWSSTTDPRSTNNAWILVMHDFYSRNKSYPNYVWPVRSGQSGTYYRLNISKSGTGIGTVISTPSGVNCGIQCSASYATGTTITLAATHVGSNFTGWSGDCSGTGECVIIMDQDRSVTAAFADTTQPTGSIFFSGGAYSNTDTVNLTLAASDAAGISKMSFSSDGQYWQAEETFSTSKLWTLSPGDGDKKIYVKFKDNVDNWSDVYSITITYDSTPPVPAITLPISGASVASVLEIRGTASDTSPSSGIAKIELQVTQNIQNRTYYLQPDGIWAINPVSPYFIPSNTSNPSSWSHNTSNITIWTTGQAYTIMAKATDKSGNTAVTSSTFTFGTASTQFTLTVSTTGTGQGAISSLGLTCSENTCTGQYNLGTQLTLSATASYGSIFTGWSGGGCTGTGTCTVTMDVAKSITANFSKNSLPWLLLLLLDD